MNIKEEEKILEKKCEITHDKIVKENILLKYNKTNSKKYSEYQISISFKNNSQNTLSNEYYDFILEINLTKKTIILFSINIKPVCDGRDILPLISKASTINNNFFSLDDIDLQDIVNNIKKFIESNNFLNLDKIYYIGDEYEPKIIDSLEHLDKIQCNHLDIINGRNVELPSLCTISDENFCLYEKEQNKYNLIFYSNIRNLLSFNKTIDSIVTLNWRKKVITNNNEITFNIFELKIEIARLESQLKNKDNVLVFNKLLERYEKIIEYYSAANNNKYVEYNEKMKDLLRNEKYSKYIN